MSIRRLLPLLLVGLSLAACDRTGSRTDGTARADAQPAPNTVVAEVDGIKITLEELDKTLGTELADVRQQEYDVRRRGIDRLVSDKLIDKEAARRGMTREALLKAEVDDKVPSPAAGEMNALYEANKFRFGTRSKEEAMRIIESSLRDRGRAERDQEFRQSLREGRQVKVALDAPRVEVPVPADAPARGPKDAKITMVEFLDYGCGFCKRAHSTVEELLKKYDGKIRFVHRDFPLSENGPTVQAARGVHCAGEQGKLWEYHSDLLSNPGAFTAEELAKRASGLGLDGGKFTTCLASGKFDEFIRKSADDGHRLGVNSTPAFYINGRKINGAQPIANFEEVIEQELAGD